jgi:hypothetical protein
MKRQLLALGTGAILLAVPASAGAYGLDPDLVWDPGVTQTCATTCTLVPDQFQNSAFRVPPQVGTTHAVITGLRVHGSGGEVRLRRLSPDARTPLASGPWTALPATPGTSVHALELPVQAGDGIGLDLRGGARVAWEPEQFLDGETVLRWEPALADGQTRAPAVERGALFLDVRIEPDTDQDGRGDESHPPVVPGPPSVCGGCAPPDPPVLTPPAADPPATTGPRTDPYAELPKAGPRVTIAGRAEVSRRGVAAVALTNPYGFALKGTVTVRRGTRALGSRKVSLAAGGRRTVRVKLDRAGRRTLARKGTLRLTLAATLRAPVGRARTTTRTVTATRATPVRRPGRSGARTPAARGGGDAGFDGTYRAPDGLVLVVQGGKVISFSGSITTYCTRTSRQKLVAYGMFGDDPDPKVAPDGRFSYEATRGYGFIKLRYDGRIAGIRASGRLAVEDRSPLLGTGRFEFDYCFAGKDWSAAK